MIDGFIQEGLGRGVATKRRRPLILTSLSKMVSAAAFTSATNPCWSRAIAGRRIALSAAVGEGADPRAAATAAISIKRRVKEARIRSPSAVRLQASNPCPNYVNVVTWKYFTRW